MGAASFNLVDNLSHGKLSRYPKDNVHVVLNAVYGMYSTPKAYCLSSDQITDNLTKMWIKIRETIACAPDKMVMKLVKALRHEYHPQEGSL